MQTCGPPLPLVAAAGGVARDLYARQRRGARGHFSCFSLFDAPQNNEIVRCRRAGDHATIKTQAQRRIAVFVSGRIIECRLGTSLKCKTFKLKMTYLKIFGSLEAVVGRLINLWPDRHQRRFARRVGASARPPPLLVALDVGASALPGSWVDKRTDSTRSVQRASTL